MARHDPLKVIRNHLHLLGLNQIDRHLDEVLAQALADRLPVTAVLEKLLECEANALVERRIERRIKEAKLPARKTLADFDFDFQKSLDKAQIMQLATLDFVPRRQGVMIAGSSGTGKSHLTQALLLLGCQQLYRCRYTTSADMLRYLWAGLADDSLERRLKVYVRPQLLLIDEVGFDRIEQQDARRADLFFKVIDARYCKASTMMTTNVDFKMLGDYLGDPVATTAIVDRMVHHSIIIHIDGPSWRMHESKQINRKSPPSK
jgi:DNA replication protein DnaC